MFGSAYQIKGKPFEKTLALAYFNKPDIELRPCPINDRRLLLTFQDN